MRFDLIWEALAGALSIIAGLFLTASPQGYVKLQKAVPWVGLLHQPPDPTEDSAEWRRWARRARLIGLFLVLLGAGLFRQARGGSVPLRYVPFHTP